MIAYKEMKTLLKKQCSNIKYFTADFYDMFKKAYRDATKAIINGDDKRYRKNGILLNHCYDPVYESEFYNKNSGAYCSFLELFFSEENIQKFVLTFYEAQRALVKKEYYLETKEIAMAYGDAVKTDFHADRVDVT